MKNFNDYRFRASQIYHIMTGTIGLTEKQFATMTDYRERHELSKKKKAKPLTANMMETLKTLEAIHKNPELPKGMITEVRKIFLQERYNRPFEMTNKYVQKGIHQEEEAITTLQAYFKEVKGINVLFSKNEERVKNEWVSGHPDLGVFGVPIKKWKEGWDTKAPWSLFSLPFPDEELDLIYECQNQAYMWLTGAEKWTTAYCLVNATEHQLFLEKQKFFYAYNSPSEGDLFYDEMIEKQKNVERLMIFDYDRFVERYPYHDLEWSRDEWYGNDLQIPIKDRVRLKKSTASEEWRNQAKERITLAREYMQKLNESL